MATIDTNAMRDRQNQLDRDSALASGRTLTEDTYFVFYGEHDAGGKPGYMTREGLEEAQRTERLMDQCGYRFTEVRHGMSMADMSA